MPRLPKVMVYNRLLEYFHQLADKEYTVLEGYPEQKRDWF